MKVLDRALQLQVLEALAEIYPQRLDSIKRFEINDERERLIANLSYLIEHGLITANVQHYLEGPAHISAIGISATGLDFLEDDGGVGAMLRVVTVRFEAETLRALIEAKVQASNLPAPEKTALTKMVRELGTEGLKTATKRLVEVGLERWPEAWQWLQALAGPGTST